MFNTTLDFSPSTMSLIVFYLQMQRQNNYNNDALVNTEFGINVKAELTSIEARVLPPPMVVLN